MGQLRTVSYELWGLARCLCDHGIAGGGRGGGSPNRTGGRSMMRAGAQEGCAVGDGKIRVEITQFT